jgi:hypothetical protein
MSLATLERRVPVTTKCTTMGCPGDPVVPGEFWIDGEDPSKVRYCRECAEALWLDGIFTPEDLSALHAAPDFTPEQKLRLAEFDEAPPAPESFDPLAVVRVINALHVARHSYCYVCDKGREVEALGNDPDCPHYPSFCREDGRRWPCPTQRVIRGEL